LHLPLFWDPYYGTARREKLGDISRNQNIIYLLVKLMATEAELRSY
jgi:hypothetical protein